VAFRPKVQAPILLSIATAVLLVGLWFVATDQRWVTDILVPSPQAVWNAFVAILRDGYKDHSLLGHLSASLGRILGAFALVIATAIPLGLWSGTNRWVRAVIDPLVEFYRPLPPLAYYTLLVLWMGIEDTSKMALLYLAGFAPVYLACAMAVGKVRPSWIQCARTLGARPHQVFFQVILPATLPDVFTGLRVALGVAYTTLVAAEMVAAVSGIGWMVLDASRFLRSDVIFVGIFLMGFTGIALDQILRAVERGFLPWRKTLPAAS